MVPKPIQNEVWRTYRPGQEISKDPSDDYMIAYRKAVSSVEFLEGKPVSFPEVLNG